MVLHSTLTAITHISTDLQPHNESPGQHANMWKTGFTWRVHLVGLVCFRELCSKIGAAGHAPPVVRHQIVRHSRLHTTHAQIRMLLQRDLALLAYSMQAMLSAPDTHGKSVRHSRLHTTHAQLCMLLQRDLALLVYSIQAVLLAPTTHSKSVWQQGLLYATRESARDTCMSCRGMARKSELSAADYRSHIIMPFCYFAQAPDLAVAFARLLRGRTQD